MNEAISKIKHFLVSEDGPTAVEYAVMLALIVVALIGTITALKTSVSTTFSQTGSALS
jgi:pilus assembly protein Flp/PilA